MAKIGTCLLENNGKIESGLAQVLIKPPKNPHEIFHNGATFRVIPNSNYCVCLFSGATSHEESISFGTPLIQECLDILSMTCKEDLATKDYTGEYLARWLEGDKNVLKTYYLFPLTKLFSDL